MGLGDSGYERSYLLSICERDWLTKSLSLSPSYETVEMKDCMRVDCYSDLKVLPQLGWLYIGGLNYKRRRAD
jgi:hypothetical protein